MATRIHKVAEDDGIGRRVRNGLNFTERGFGVRGALGVPDRGHSAASQLGPGQFDWPLIFGKLGVRWFHTGGIFAGLSESTAALTIEAVKAAKNAGTIVSYDLNYRPSLWKGIGGLKRAQEVNKEIAPCIDVMIGNEEDFYRVARPSGKGRRIQECRNRRRRLQGHDRSGCPRLSQFQCGRDHAAAGSVSATRNDWSAILWHAGQFHESRKYPDLEILDRVGGGDSFASGLQFAFLAFNDPQKAVDFGAAHGALASTTPGDTSMATRAEVERLVAGGNARVIR